MVTNDDGSHAEEGGRSRSWMPWRQTKDSDPTTSTGAVEPIRATGHQRIVEDRIDGHEASGHVSDQVVDDREGRHGIPGRDWERGDVDRGDSDRAVGEDGGRDSGHVQQVVDRNTDARNNRDDRVGSGQDNRVGDGRLGDERDAHSRNDLDDVDRRGSDRASDDWPSDAHVERDDRRDAGCAVVDHESVTQAQKEEHGGVKVGSAFFGWLTATGMAVLLTALLAAAGAAVGVGSGTDITQATDTAASNSKTVGIIGSIVLLVIVLVAYYCGGYVAGRMARFNGISQGVAVWVWTLVIAVLLAVLTAAAGQKYNVSATLNLFPRIPVNEGTLTTAGMIALAAVAVVALIGAILGGLAGMHYHRRVDRAVPIAGASNR